MMLSSVASGQFKTTMTFYSTDHLCSTRYIFDSLGQFYLQGGCEGRGFISYGKYELKNDKLILNFQKIDTGTLFLKIKESKATNDTTIRVSFMDRYQNPIVRNYLKIDAIESSGKFFKPVSLDDKGGLTINPSKYHLLRLYATQGICGKLLYVALNTNDKEIIINFPKEFFYISYPILDNSKNYILTLKKDGLYDSAGKGKIVSLEK